MKKRILAAIISLGIVSTTCSSFTLLNDTNSPQSITALMAVQKAGINDSTFGTSGVGTYDIASLVDVGRRVIELPDGSYVVAGTYSGSTGAVLLYMDKTGMVTKTVQTTDITVVSGLTRSSSAVYLIGDNGSQTKVLAYDFSGNVVTTFGTSGVKTVGSGLTTSLGGVYYKDGLFVLAYNGGTTKSLYKLDATGTAVSGFTTIDLQSGFPNGIAAMTAYDGNLYVVGTGPSAGNTEVRKYSATTGDQVTSGFGASGVVTAGNSLAATSISIDQTTGTLYVLKSDGSSALIYIFDTTGTQVGSMLTISNFSNPQCIVAAPGGVQYVFGYHSGSSSAKVARVFGGALDTTNFAPSNGYATITGFTAVASGLVSAIGGKVLLVGNNSADIKVWRLTGGSGNGSVDSLLQINQESDNASGIVGLPL